MKRVSTEGVDDVSIGMASGKASNRLSDDEGMDVPHSPQSLHHLAPVVPLVISIHLSEGHPRSEHLSVS
jgi:hypothetical protein